MKKIILILVLFSFIACQNDDDSVTSVQVEKDFEYEKHEDFSAQFPIPKDINKIISITSNKLDSSDNVILIIQGGPLTELSIEKDFPDFSKHIKELNSTIVLVHQINTFYGEKKGKEYIHSKISTYDEGLKANNSNAEMVMRVAKFYKEKGKKVYVYGASYGAFLLNHVITRYPKGNTKIIDKIAFLVGRLDFTTEMKGFASTKIVDKYKLEFYNEGGDFEESGDDPIEEVGTITQLIPITDKEEGKGSINFNAMILPIVKDYTEILKNTQDNKNRIWYCVGEYDTAVGRVSKKEELFANEKYSYSSVSKGLHVLWKLPKIIDLATAFFYSGNIPPEIITGLEYDSGIYDK